MDDRLLLEMIAKGDKSAVQVLFARHHTRVYRFVERQVGDPGLAEEVANEVFLDAWRGASRYEGRSAVSTWLLSIARNKALSALRKRREFAMDDEIIGSIEDDADDPEVSVQKGDKSDLIRALLDQLSPDHKAIIDLAYYQELSVREVAEVLDIPANTVKTRMFHARKHLAKLLDEAGIDRGWP